MFHAVKGLSSLCVNESEKYERISSMAETPCVDLRIRFASCSWRVTDPMLPEETWALEARERTNLGEKRVAIYLVECWQDLSNCNTLCFCRLRAQERPCEERRGRFNDGETDGDKGGEEARLGESGWPALVPCCVSSQSLQPAKEVSSPLESTLRLIKRGPKSSTALLDAPDVASRKIDAKGPEAVNCLLCRKRCMGPCWSKLRCATSALSRLGTIIGTTTLSPIFKMHIGCRETCPLYIFGRASWRSCCGATERASRVTDPQRLLTHDGIEDSN
jgi:hypothetical protein